MCGLQPRRQTFSSPPLRTPPPKSSYVLADTRPLLKQPARALMIGPPRRTHPPLQPTPQRPWFRSWWRQQAARPVPFLIMTSSLQVSSVLVCPGGIRTNNLKCSSQPTPPFTQRTTYPLVCFKHSLDQALGGMGGSGRSSGTHGRGKETPGGELLHCHETYPTSRPQRPHEGR